MNNEDNNICREGIVRSVEGDEITVEVIVSSACSGCHAKSICIPSDRRQERITVKNTRNEQYEVGETVELLLETSAGNKAVVLAYVLPLIVLLMLLFGCYALTHKELLSVGVGVLGVVLYYLILKSAGKSIEKGITFGIRKKAVQ
ncbi:MAG: SoxR reducing system RseC family protein [Bacteroidales bacterium]|jgi:sigma-E factor negative regulatory protein RseC|nr:SoxR reducing system RseC family protein [Bacteroidales bacterium]